MQGPELPRPNYLDPESERLHIEHVPPVEEAPQSPEGVAPAEVPHDEAAVDDYDFGNDLELDDYDFGRVGQEPEDYDFGKSFPKMLDEFDNDFNKYDWGKLPPDTTPERLDAKVSDEPEVPPQGPDHPEPGKDTRP